GARQNFIENRVAPLCRPLEAEERQVVKSFRPDAEGWFDLDSLPIMQQAQRTRLAAARSAFDMGIPFNELNRVLDLGFKPLPWGEKGWVGSGLQQIGEQSSKLQAPSFRRREDAMARQAREAPSSKLQGLGCGDGGPFGRALDFLSRSEETSNLKPQAS